MSISAELGPKVIYGDRSPIGSGGFTNPDYGPSLVAAGWALFDPRVGYNVTRAGAIGWDGVSRIPVIDAVPSTLSATNMAAAQVPVAATPLTLVSATGSGITVLATATTVWSSGNLIPANALAIDAGPGLIAFGRTQNGASGNTRISVYDPSKAIARNVRITSVGNDSAASFLVAGYDLYGYPQTEAITGANATVAAGKKAFKFITSVTPSGTLSGSNVSVGTGDVYGFPLRADTFGYAEMVWNNATITASTGFVAADATSPATTTTGDVRGTYAVQSASDGTKRLQVFITPAAANVNTVAGLVGVTPV